jgi:hypothetical protein
VIGFERGWHGRRQQQRETIPLVDMMRRLSSRMQLTCREQKQSSDRGWKGEEVLMSVEGYWFGGVESLPEDAQKSWFRKGHSCGGGRL